MFQLISRSYVQMCLSYRVLSVVKNRVVSYGLFGEANTYYFPVYNQLLKIKACERHRHITVEKIITFSDLR